MPFLSQINFGEIRHDEEFHLLALHGDDRHAFQPVRFPVATTLGLEPALQDGLDHRSHRKGRQRPAHVLAGIAVLQAADQYRIQRRSGNHSKFSGFRDRPRQPPVGDRNAHAALDDARLSGFPIFRTPRRSLAGGRLRFGVGGVRHAANFIWRVNICNPTHAAHVARFHAKLV